MSTRREFLRQAAIVGGLLAAGIRLPARAETETAGQLRLVFATDLHLMLDNGLRSEDGIREALAAIEALKPAPDLMICGGDLTDPSPSLDCTTAETLLNRFETIWTPTVETLELIVPTRVSAKGFTGSGLGCTIRFIASKKAAGVLLFWTTCGLTQTEPTSPSSWRRN
jgi:hypothetical protein